MKKLIFLLIVLCATACSSKKSGPYFLADDSYAGKDLSFMELAECVDSIMGDTTKTCLNKRDFAYINQYADSILAMRNATPFEDRDKGFARYLSMGLANDLLCKKIDSSCEPLLDSLREKLNEVDNKFTIQGEDSTSVLFNLNGFFSCQRLLAFNKQKAAYLFLDLDKNTGACNHIYISLSSHFDECKGVFPVFAFADENERNEVSEKNFSDNLASDQYMFECDNRCFDRFLNKDKMLVVIQDAEGNVDTWLIRLGWFQKQYREYFGK